MDPKALRSGYERVLQSIYSPAAYYRRARTFLREYRSLGRRTHVGRPEIIAFLRSLYRLGIVGRERFQYWKLLMWTALRRPRLIGDAIRLAIMGHHCRKVCDRVLAGQ